MHPKHHGLLSNVAAPTTASCEGKPTDASTSTEPHTHKLRALGLTLALGLFALAFLAAPIARGQASLQTRSVRILPVGDSITEGYYDTTGGYRKHLWAWRALVGDFVFVGPRGSAPLRHDATNTRTSAQLASDIADSIRTSRPHLLLLHVGKNDVLLGGLFGNKTVKQISDEVIANLNAILDTVNSSRHGLPWTPWVLLHELLPVAGFYSNARTTAAIREINARLLPDVVLPQLRRGHFVWVTPTLVPITAADLADGVHPDPAGKGFQKLAFDHAAFLMQLIP